jgi:hypothetical protein
MKSKLLIMIVLVLADLSCQRIPLARETPQPTPITEGELSIEAGLVYKSGDVKPVARNDFYLLDGDAERILQQANIERKGKLRNPNLTNLDAYAAAEACMNIGTECPSFDASWYFHKRAMEVIKPHILQTITTGFDGKAKFEPLPAGDYYVMGVMTRDKGFVCWNLKVTLKPGTQTVILDQNNAQRVI